jgi:hypothetical protein
VTRLGSPLRDARSAALLVAAAAVLVFANSLPNEFAYDDHHIVLENTAIQSLSTLPGAVVKPYWPTPYGRELGLWRPVTTAAFGVQWQLGGGSPLVYHVVNVTGHAAAAVLLLLILTCLLPLPAALAGALLFAVHPVHVEAVANVVGFSEIYSTAFLLAACLVHLRATKASGWGAPLAIGALYALGFGAKESAVTLPGLVFLLDAARGDIGLSDLGGYVRERWRTYAVMAMVAAGLLLGRYAVLGSLANPFAPLGADQLNQLPRIWTLGDIWTNYVRLWVFPLDLSADYSPNVVPVSLAWHLTNVVGVLVALAILTTALVSWRQPALSTGALTARAFAFGVVWFVIAISPVSNTVFLSGVILAERTLYLPSVGLAAGAGWLVLRMAQDRPRGAWVVAGLVLVLLTARTWTRNPTWKDNAHVFANLIGDSPHSGRSQWILGDEFLRLRTDSAESSALRAYSASIGMLGQDYQLLTQISMRLVPTERYRLIEFLLNQALEADSRFALAPALLAIVRAEHADAAGTERYARMSLAIDQEDAVRWYMLAWALAAQGEWDEAAEAQATADSQASAAFWQRWLYLAYARRHEGDTVAAYQALDSAWSIVATRVGREALDSVRVSVFGAPSLLDDRVPPEDTAGVPLS